jgi:site-specific DNA-cytosine methylase
MKKDGLRVLSLCDGISNLAVALKKAGFTNFTYYSSEIDKNAIAISKYNFPDQIRLGDLTLLTEEYIKSLKIDFIVYGSACQSLSLAGASSGNYCDGSKGVITGKSAIFYNCYQIQKWCMEANPECKFLVENVRMAKPALKIFEDTLGVKGVLMNSAHFGAQRRVRYYFSNINFQAPPKELWSQKILKDVLLPQVDDKYYLSETQQSKIKWLKKENNKIDTQKIGYIEKEYNKNCENYPASQGTLIHSSDGKAPCAPANTQGMNWVADKHPTVTTSLGRQGSSKEFIASCKAIGGIRRLCPQEVEALFNLPKDFTKYGIDSQGKVKEMKDGPRYVALGNSFDSEVVKYIILHK